MQTKSQIQFRVVIAIIVLVAITAPYLYASSAAGDDYRFAGFLSNPLDGLTYLAKMYQGWEGNWRNQMAYTAEPGEGVFINLFYISLGHMARVTSLPLIGVYHGARIFGAMILLGILYRFYGAVFPKSQHRWLAFALAALGSGLGWLGLSFGLFTADMWVAETYPFLAAYTNPHFVFSLVLVIWLIMQMQAELKTWKAINVLFVALLLSVVSPFGVIVVIIIQAGVLLGKVLLEGTWRQLVLVKDEVQKLCLILFGGAPFLVYYFWISQNHPVIAIWNAQNVTLSPVLWDLLISLSPALLLAGFGAWSLLKQYKSEIIRHPAFICIVWAGLGLALIYLPGGLQRRFMLGLFIPLSGLAIVGLGYLAPARRRYRFLAIFLFVLSIPTNLVVMMAGLHGISTHNEIIYLTADEDRAISWIEENASKDALVLASPGMGIFIPAFTGRRVIYGHPFETVNAETEELAVTSYFSGKYSPIEAQSFVADRQVDLIFYGPREQALGDLKLFPDFTEMYSNQSVIIYRVDE